MSRLSSVGLLAAAISAACDGGGSNRRDTDPPYVVETTPPWNAIDVPADTTVTARFSEEMAPASLSTTTFTLEDASHREIPAAVAYVPGARTATLTPVAPLERCGQYRAIVRQGATDVAGLALNRTTDWPFRVQCWRWDVVHLGETAGTSFPRVVAAVDGSAVAVWNEEDGFGPTAAGTVLARRWDPAAGAWGEPEVIGTSVVRPAVGAAAGGDALAVWGQDGWLRARRFDAGAATWNAGTWITPAYQGWFAAVATADDGFSVAAWTGPGGVQASRWGRGAVAWEDPWIVGPCADAAGGPLLALAAAGRGLLAHSCGDLVVRRLFGGVWQDPEHVGSGPLATATSFAAAVNGRGDALVAWVELAGPPEARALRARRFTVASQTWGAVEDVDALVPTFGGQGDVKAAFLGDEDVLLVWQGDFFGARALRSQGGSGWVKVPQAGTGTFSLRRFLRECALATRGPRAVLVMPDETSDEIQACPSELEHDAWACGTVGLGPAHSWGNPPPIVDASIAGDGTIFVSGWTTRGVGVSRRW